VREPVVSALARRARTLDDLRLRPCASAGYAGAEWRFRRPAHGDSCDCAIREQPVDAAIAACEQGSPGMFLSYQVAAAVAERKLRYVLAEFELDPVPVNVIYPQARLRSSTVRAFVDTAASTLRATRFV
jgi:DNA-binding transcriptional LysR family regulator